MRWTIAELKTRGLAAFKANYWPCVAAALIAIVANGGCHFSTSQKLKTDSDGQTAATAPAAPESDRTPSAATTTPMPVSPTAWATLKFGDLFCQGRELRNENPRVFTAAVVLVGLLLAVVVSVALLIRFLLLNPLSVGCYNFFLKNAAAQAGFNAIGAPFRDWKRTAKTMFLRDIFLFLWGLPGFIAFGACAIVLFVVSSTTVSLGVFFAWFAAAVLLSIPAIVKLYAYRLVPYLLSDDPSLAGRAAITRSRELMAGNKFRVWLLDLSFLGWHLLSILTCGILWVFRVFPWLYATDAELYRAIAPRPSALPPPLPPAP
jgi:uncharacterized membrane protein